MNIKKELPEAKYFATYFEKLGFEKEQTYIYKINLKIRKNGKTTN